MTADRRYSDDALDVHTAKLITKLESTGTAITAEMLAEANRRFTYWTRRKAALIDPAKVGRPDPTAMKHMQRALFYATAERAALRAVHYDTKVMPVRRPAGIAAKRATARYRLKQAMRLGPLLQLQEAEAREVRDAAVSVHGMAYAEWYVAMQEADIALARRRVKLGTMARNVRGTVGVLASLKDEVKRTRAMMREAQTEHRRAAAALAACRKRVLTLTDDIAKMEIILTMPADPEV